MKRVKKKGIFKFIIGILIIIVVLGFTSYRVHEKVVEKRDEKKEEIGDVIDTYNGVEVYYNGSEYGNVYGENYNKDGYYYGYKWQCVEFVKRYYYDLFGHRMPDGYGNAKDFFDKDVPQGKMNKKRGLIQYRNGEGESPKEDDILIFTDTTYGHIVIISEVGDDYIEVVQQNMGSTSRDRFDLKYEGDKYFIGGKRSPAGWLRRG